MCIAGDWEAFVEYFKDKKNMTEGEMLSVTYKAYREKIGEHKYVKMTCNNKTNTISVYAVENQKQMRSSETARQFSLQITNAKNEEYAAADYAINNGAAVSAIAVIIAIIAVSGSSSATSRGTKSTPSESRPSSDTSKKMRARVTVQRRTKATPTRKPAGVRTP